MANWESPCCWSLFCSSGGPGHWNLIFKGHCFRSFLLKFALNQVQKVHISYQLPIRSFCRLHCSSPVCSLHGYGCCSCQVMLTHPHDTPSTVTRIKLQAESDSIQAWLQAVVLVAVVVARLDGWLVGYWLFLFWTMFGFGLFFGGDEWHTAYIQPVLLHKSTNLVHLKSDTLSSVRN